jgi:hypothetical protein
MHLRLGPQLAGSYPRASTREESAGRDDHSFRQVLHLQTSLDPFHNSVVVNNP